jgi:hypothetical protein
LAFLPLYAPYWLELEFDGQKGRILNFVEATLSTLNRFLIPSGRNGRYTLFCDFCLFWHPSKKPEEVRTTKRQNRVRPALLQFPDPARRPD